MRHSFMKWHIALAVFMMVAFTSCDSSFLFDGEGNCPVEEEPGPGEPNNPVYRVQFVYDYNMSYTDFFAQQVSTVTLYLIDKENNVVWQKTEEGAILTEAGYVMDVDVDPGEYSLLVWCGTKDYGSFYVPSSNVLTDLTCNLDRKYSADGSAYIDTNIDRWFHGYLSTQVFPSEDGVYLYTVPLIKDTNHWMVYLQHENGSAIDVNEFSFSITADNGYMDWDNSLIKSEDITYRAWNTYNGESTVSGDTIASAAIAELTIARMVKGNEPNLTVTNNQTGETVFSVPLIDYALLIKSNYSNSMDDQEFLDREDEWDIVFLLSEDNYWLPAVIYINSWRVVLQHTGL